jgi:hypothetical protein
MKRFTRFSPAWIVALVLSLIGSAATVRAQLLDQIPSDAMAVMQLKNLNAVNEKAAALAKQFGLVEMNPAAADPLGALLGSAGITNGIDRGGDAGAALLNHDFNQGDGEPPVIILIPVTDYAAFIGNFGDAKKDGDFDVVHMTFNGQKDNDDTFVAHWGKYAVLSDKKERLEKKPDGFKPTAATAKELASKDMVWIGNFKVLGPKLNDLLKGHKDEMLAQLDKGLSRDEKFTKYAPLIKVAVQQGLGAAESFLTDTQAITFSVNLNKEGIGTSFMIDFAPESRLGKVVASVKESDGPLLAGLPEAKYMLFGGSINASDGATQIFSDFIKPIRDELGKAGDDLKPAVDLLDNLQKMMAATKAQTMGMIAPTGALGAAAIIQTVVITTGDAKTLMEIQPKLMEAQQQLMEMIPNQPKMKFSVAPAAKTVDGVQFNQVTYDITGTDPASMQAKQMFAIMYGPSGAGALIGMLDDQHLLALSGIDDATISATIKAAKEKSNVVAQKPGVQLVAKNLPQKRIGEFYVAVDEIVTTATNYAKMMGMPIPVNIKPDLPPIGMAVATEGSAGRIDAYIPADLVEQMITTALQVRMMGAGGRGKPGGL